MSAHLKRILWIAVTLALASVGPLIFPAAQAGYGSLAVMSTRLLLPAILVLAVVAGLAWRRQPLVARSIISGALAGSLATLALEAIRLPGFHFGFMPGNLPRLMGVLLLDRFALGPSLASDVAGWAYHFWNGACFGILYTFLFGTERRWVGVVFGIIIGLGFLVSPVVISLGAGYFGLEFSYSFPATVLLAHLGFGAALALLARRFSGSQPSLVVASLRAVFTSSLPSPSAADER